ncbi:hypothetical protein C5Y93_09195 [Blastopirellula marina]|uniref:Tetratricopeptide repeat protein n=2 Tax=Blastopirellula marina TaxID=124 RepID=A0A2S8GP03_9BACT|nr:hypothetical protein C5Y93_09195 [Blastopirellula marina]
MVLGSAIFAAPLQADRLILRDLTLIQNVTVIGFDEEGVKVTDQSLIPWYAIELGTVDPEKQADFDRLRDELGVPLFRVHQRLKVGDYAGAREPAEAIFPRYQDRDSNVAYLVCQATMWGRIAEGDRAAALEPYFCCLRMLKTGKVDPKKLPGDRKLDFDKSTGLTGDLLPIFFDQEKAAAALPLASAAAGKIRGIPDGVYIYLASLSIAANDLETADTWQKKIRTGHPILKEWNDLLLANTMVQMNDLRGAWGLLEPKIHALEPWNQPVARYLLGVSQSRSNEYVAIENGILDLLHLPAMYGSKHPELAAAALVETDIALRRIQQLEQAAEIRRQLLFYYGGTLHAERMRTASPSPSNP